MAISDTVASLLGFAQRQVDRLVSPESQQRAYSRVSDFAAARPLLFVRPVPCSPALLGHDNHLPSTTNLHPETRQTFILTQLSLAAIPTLFFLAFAVSTAFFILGLGLLLTLFCLGLGFAVLVPALCLACGVATCLWTWGVVAYLAARRAAGVLTGTSAVAEDEDPQPPPPLPAALIPQPSSSTPSSDKLEEQGHAKDMDVDEEADDARDAGSDAMVEEGNIQGT